MFGAIWRLINGLIEAIRVWRINEALDNDDFVKAHQINERRTR